MPSDRGTKGSNRRTFLASCAALGLGGPAFGIEPGGRPLEDGEITLETVRAAEKIAGLQFSDQERELFLDELKDLVEDYRSIRALDIPNEVSPALIFDPLSSKPAADAEQPPRKTAFDPSRIELPADASDPSFLTVAQLARLLRERRLKSVDLTRHYLTRLKRHDETLHCVISLTEERALEEAARADRELDGGDWRGPLHGVPWGAKDLLAAIGYRTTWGAKPYEEQVIDADATVVGRLGKAGAVLAAKLTLGALAWGDVWFGGTTRNPWNPEQGSSGSSAGSSAATAAGLVGFAIGTETYGSIVSPCTRCGATGLRPTFGRVSRHGAMALSWSMDKIGPICRSVEDCALVFDAIHGPDGLDHSVIDRPFAWDRDLDIAKLRVGYVKSAFEREPDDEEAREVHALDMKVLEKLESLGVKLIPFELPEFPVRALSFILSAEAAAAFEELTLSGRDDLLVRQIKNAWPNTFRQARLIPAVDYIQANRARTMLMRQMEDKLADLDLYVCPSYGGSNLLLTNLTGHPAVVLPHGFRADGTPASITFNGRLFGEAAILAVARAYQDATGWHLRRPPLFS